MPVTNVGSRWSSGDLIFYEKNVSLAALGNIMRVGDDAVEIGSSTNDIDVKIWMGSTQYAEFNYGDHKLTLSTVDVDLSGDLTVTVEDISIAATKYIYLDGQDGNDYLRASTDNNVILNGQTTVNLGVAGTTEVAVSSTAVTLATNNLTLTAGNISVAQGYYYYLDGQGGGEYIRSDAIGRTMINATAGIDLAINGTDELEIDSADVSVLSNNLNLSAGSFSVVQGQYVRFDGPTGGERIYSQAADKLTIRASGTSYDDLTLSCTTLAMDNIRMTAAKKIEFRDADIYIASLEDGSLSFVADSYMNFVSSCIVYFNDATAATSSTAGAMVVAGGIACAKNMYLGTDLYMASGKKIDFASDVTLTHSSNLLTVAGGNLRMATSDRLEFRDNAIYIYSSEDTGLHIVADGYLTITPLTYFSNYLVLRKTDTASTSQGAIWMHETGDLLKYRTATNTRTVAALEEENTFTENMTIDSTKRISFRDNAIYIYSSEDGALSFVADSYMNFSCLTYFNGGIDNTSGYIRLMITNVPASTQGQMWFDTGDNKIHYYNGTAEKIVAQE